MHGQINKIKSWNIQPFFVAILYFSDGLLLQTDIIKVNINKTSDNGGFVKEVNLFR